MRDLTNQRKTFYKTRNLLPAIVLVALGLFGHCTAKAQYGDSYSRIMDMTRTWNQNLWDDQKRLNDVTSRSSNAGTSSGTVYGQGQSQNKAPARQFPITATDFRPVSGYVLPDELANSAAGLKPDAREELRGLYKNILSSFEREARKNNMANAFAFVVAVSIQVVDGKELSDDYTNTMIGYFNNRLAGIPQYNAMAPQQKQAMYESLVICGGIIAFLDAQGKATNNTAMQTQARDLSRAVLKQFLGIVVP